MRPSSDPEAFLGELVSLWTAASADALHRVLVLHPYVRESADAFEPIALLTEHHATEPGTSVATATLLLTDRRWRGGAGQLVRGIADSGLLTPEQLDGMALAFLAADRYVYWPVPDAWFTTESVALVVSDDVGDDADEVAVSEGPAVAARDVAPPLRRWAAARLVAREPAAWPRLLARAQDLDARHGAAVVAGMFDSIEVMPAAAQGLARHQGDDLAHQSVRRAALEVPDSGVTPDITIECTGVAEVIADVIANSAPDAITGVSTPSSPLPFDLGGWNRGAVLGNDINLIRPRC